MDDNIIEKIQNVIKPVLDKEPEFNSNFPVEFTLYHILERANCSINSLRILSKESIVTNDHAIGLISRNILTDFILISYIIVKSDSKEDLRWYYALYRSDYNKMKSYLNFAERHKFVSSQELIELNKIYENDFYKIIKTNSEIEKVNFPSMKDIVEEFMTEFQTHLLANHISAAYDIWILLSKYEHLGIHSYTLTRQVPVENLKARLDTIISKSFILSGICLEGLYEDKAYSELLKLTEDVYCA